MVGSAGVRSYYLCDQSQGGCLTLVAQRGVCCFAKHESIIASSTIATVLLGAQEHLAINVQLTLMQTPDYHPVTVGMNGFMGLVLQLF